MHNAALCSVCDAALGALCPTPLCVLSPCLAASHHPAATRSMLLLQEPPNSGSRESRPTHRPSPIHPEICLAILPDTALQELPNPDPLENRPTHGGRDRHTCVGEQNKLQRCACWWPTMVVHHASLLCLDRHGAGCLKPIGAGALLLVPSR